MCDFKWLESHVHSTARIAGDLIRRRVGEFGHQ
jgi:hypothetical protein